MPKVTLLGPPGKDYRIFFGKKELRFSSGVPNEVPVNVALELKRKVNRKGKPRFKVEESDTPVAIPIVLPENHQIPEQNVLIPRQMRFGSWL